MGYRNGNLALRDEWDADLDLLENFKIGERSKDINTTVGLLDDEKIREAQKYEVENKIKSKIRDEINKIKKQDNSKTRGAEYAPSIQLALNFLPFRKLEGEVFLINQEKREVSIRFQEIGGDDQVVEEAVFDMEDISPEDHDLLKEGAVVYWNIGYLDRTEGRQKISELRFRRLPVWSKEDIKHVKKKAKSFKDFFSPDSKKK